jgi:hypothetical protein
VSPYDDNNQAAWWVAGIVGFGVFVWKAIFFARRDSRDDREGRSRQDLIDQLQEEIKSKNEFIVTLSDQLNAESDRRREAEDKNFDCRQRERALIERLKELGDKQ